MIQDTGLQDHSILKAEDHMCSKNQAQEVNNYFKKLKKNY
jgi:hypothetical protein